jgi:hypothetical protein
MYKYKDCCVENDLNTNAAFTTVNARLRLYEMLDIQGVIQSCTDILTTSY